MPAPADKNMRNIDALRYRRWRLVQGEGNHARAIRLPGFPPRGFIVAGALRLLAVEDAVGCSAQVLTGRADYRGRCPGGQLSAPHPVPLERIRSIQCVSRCHHRTDCGTAPLRDVAFSLHNRDGTSLWRGRPRPSLCCAGKRCGSHWAFAKRFVAPVWTSTI
jgi:hypothetical protein